MVYLGSSVNILANCSSNYIKLIDEIERDLLLEKINNVKS